MTLSPFNIVPLYLSFKRSEPSRVNWRTNQRWLHLHGYECGVSPAGSVHLLHIPERQMVLRETPMHHLLHTHIHGLVFRPHLLPTERKFCINSDVSYPHVLLSWTFYSPCSLWLTLQHRGFGVFHCIVIPSVSPREISDIPLTLQLYFSFWEILLLQIHSSESEWKKPPDTSACQRQQQL